MKANLFDVLNRVNTEHEGSLHAYFSNNVIDLHAGRDGWGNIKIAITTSDAQELMNGIMAGNSTRSVMLFIIDRNVMETVKTEIEAKE